MKIAHFLFSVFLFIGTVLYAQPENYKFGHLDISNGISNNQIVSVFKDSRGFMWFGTQSGLNRYDGYSFKIFKHSLRDSLSIRDNFIYGINEDHNGNLWIGTRFGYNIYNPLTESFSWNPEKYLRDNNIPLTSINNLYTDKKGNVWFLNRQEGIVKVNTVTNKRDLIKNIPFDSTSVKNSELSSLVEGNNGDYWIIHRDGVLEKMDGKTNKIVQRDYFIYRILGNVANDYSLFVDSDGDLWITITNSPNGVFYYNPKLKRIKHITNTSQEVRLNTNIVRAVVQDNNGFIWIATDHGGINILNKHNFRITYLLQNPDDNKSITQNSFTCLYKDNSSIIWAGTFKKGINYFHDNLIRFKLLKHQSRLPNSLGFDDVNCFAEDAKENLWIGTNGGGLIYYDRTKENFKQYLNNPSVSNSLSNNVIVSLCIDHEQKLWIGTYYGGLNCFVNDRFRHFKKDPRNPQSLNNDNVWELYEDRQNRLWVGTLGGGLDLYDRKNEIFSHFNTRVPNTIYSDYLSAVLQDKEGKLWIGTAYGVNVFYKDSFKTWKHYLRDNQDNSSISNNNILSILEDSRGLIWVGTREGLNCFDKKTQKFKNFREEDGLPDNSIISMVEDNNGNLWLGTPNGLSNLIITKKPGEDSITYLFKNYDESDGLQGKEFNENAAFRTKKGELVFGGINGFNIFFPQDIKVNMNLPKVVITDFQIFNKSIKVNEEIDGRVLLRQSIINTREITLKYRENIFVVEFAALSYFQPEKNKYSYILEGFNKDWITVDSKMRKATYTNLDPGEYVFRVKAANNDGFWNTEETVLKIVILPPFWRTKLAIVLYILVILAILYISRRMILERARMRFNLEHERHEAQRMHELDMLKIRFFTNVSHEFRTPLTLIITPIEKLIKNTIDPELNKQYVMINRNARRLLNLINQLLDFRRMEVQEFHLSLIQADIILFIRDIVNSFSDISEKKNIQLSVISHIESLNTYFDQDKLEKILFNLLSNAFKFTGEMGTVKVELNTLEAELSVELPDKKGKYLQIKVSDTGIGIAKEKHEKVFERFFQNEIPGDMLNQGSGIGLALTREFVKLHEGVITLQSEPGKGSCFTVYIPLKENGYVKENIFPVKEDFISDNNTIEASNNGELESISKGLKKALLLLVEDNEDFRFYLKDNLKQQYQIVEAPNGQVGLKAASHFIPDLIVSDVMMPVMDGIDFCKRVKSDQRTSHIPVILLTAKAASDQIITGFQTGADDYITKPFNFEILLSRIKNLLSQRELMRKSFIKHVEINPSEITVTPLDEKLINKAIALVESNISNADFSVEELSRELGMSRVHLYKKLLSITGKTPIEFIRTIRLKRAAQLLKKSQLTISEIAYQVGFNNPKYFTKYFKSEFNVLPSQYISNNSEKG
jgi:signal transduction histidine kinase/ligand-binding sensor domain-containing protein/DNA-binding response OmpR family regulator